MENPTPEETNKYEGKTLYIKSTSSHPHAGHQCMFEKFDRVNGQIAMLMRNEWGEGFYFFRDQINDLQIME